MLIIQNPDTSPAQFLVRFWVKDLQFELANSKIQANFQTTFRCPDRTFSLVLEPELGLEYHRTSSLDKFSFSRHIIYALPKMYHANYGMWPLLTGPNNTVQSQALVILGCVHYIGGIKSGFLTRPGMEFFWKAPGTQGLRIWRALLPTETNIPSQSNFSWNWNLQFSWKPRTETQGSLENQEWDMWYVKSHFVSLTL